MPEHPSHARIRIALAQFCTAHNIDLEELYAALGIAPGTADAEALAHMAGVLDGMTVASTRIRQHGLDGWAKDL